MGVGDGGGPEITLVFVLVRDKSKLAGLARRLDREPIEGAVCERVMSPRVEGPVDDADAAEAAAIALVRSSSS